MSNTETKMDANKVRQGHTVQFKSRTGSHSLKGSVVGVTGKTVRVLVQQKDGEPTGSNIYPDPISIKERHIDFNETLGE